MSRRSASRAGRDRRQLSREQAQEQSASGKVYGALVIPADFTSTVAQLTTSQATTRLLLTDPLAVQTQVGLPIREHSRRRPGFPAGRPEAGVPESGPSGGHAKSHDSCGRLRDPWPVTMGPDLLSLNIICPPPEEGGVEVRPVVNGRDLLADVFPGGVGGSRYLGVGPRYLLDRDGPLHATAVPHAVRLAWSGCGVEECCGALYMTVRRDGEHVVWAGWRDLANQDFDLPEFRFTASQYEAEVLRAEEDRSWEWPAGAVARLLEAGLRGREDWLVRWECELEAIWASRKQPDRIHVLLRYPPDRADTDLPWIQFGMTLPISVDEPSDQAEHLEARLTAGDPRATAEVWGGSHDAELLGYPWPPVDPLFT